VKKLPSAEADAESQQPLPVLKPATQIDFYARLQAVKERYLHDALKETIEEATFDLRTLDGELASFAVASFHLRGETFFPVPYLLKRNAYLLGYYRLLYGFSCKAFYGQGPFKRFQRMEDDGLVDLRIEPSLPVLCRSLCATGGMLVDAVKSVSLGTVFELQLLTLGPQFKGGGNVKLGQGAIDTFFMLLKSLLSPYNPKVKGRQLTFVNDSKLTVVVRVASDPDVSITQQLDAEERKLVAIELKGGTDVSNIWKWGIHLTQVATMGCGTPLGSTVIPAYGMPAGGSYRPVTGGPTNKRRKTATGGVETRPTPPAPSAGAVSGHGYATRAARNHKILGQPASSEYPIYLESPWGGGEEPSPGQGKGLQRTLDHYESGSDDRPGVTEQGEDAVAQHHKVLRSPSVHLASTSIMDFNVFGAKVSPGPWNFTVTRRPSSWQ